MGTMFYRGDIIMFIMSLTTKSELPAKISNMIFVASQQSRG